MPRPGELAAVAVIVVALGYLLFARRGDAKMQTASTGIGVDSLIAAVKGELRASDSARIANDELPMFHLKGFDVEVNFVVARTATGTAKAEVRPVVIEIGTEVEMQRVHKLAVHFEPLTPEEVKALLRLPKPQPAGPPKGKSPSADKNQR